MNVLAVDIGGTFTDVVVLDTPSGEVRMAKVPTRPDAPAAGVLEAVEKAGASPGGADAFFHGTTLGLNTLLERKGALTGLITTEGFRDVLEIGRSSWPMYRLHWDRPEPLVPRYLRCEARERVLVDGVVIEPLDEEQVRAALDHFVAEGVEAMAVCFLHSYINPVHELRVAEIVEQDYPSLACTLSHHLTREYREFERTSTVVVDAYIRTRVTGYLDTLDNSLAGGGFLGELFITRSDGGVMTAQETRRRSVLTLTSGPASGVMGAALLAKWLGHGNLIAADMGGTSFDAALIVDHEPLLRPEARIEEIPLLMPIVELATIGAGGGSIAWLDTAGSLHVGPQSAGADPGPICYGKGGMLPTFTDAALVSGLLEPGNFLGGEIRLDIDAARRGIDEAIASPLGLEVAAAASGIVALIEARMAATLEHISIGKGYDPREFWLVAYGGGGPLVGAALAERLQVPRVVVPVSPAAFSAWGMLTLDLVYDFSRTTVQKLELVTGADIVEAFAELSASATEALARDDVPPDRRQLRFAVDMRYEGQEHTLTIRLDENEIEHADLDRLRARFDQEHEAAYTYSLGDPVELVAYRMRAVGLLAKPEPPVTSRAASGWSEALVGHRHASHHASGGELAWDVYDRGRAPAGVGVAGPAIVQEPSATTIVPPEWTAEVDQLGNLLLDWSGQ